MARYDKGASAERELNQLFYNLGFSVVRIAGSGKSSLPAPDIVALRPGKQLAIECKAWKGNYLNISNQQIQELASWSERAGTDFFVGWKIPHKGWKFLKPEQFNRSQKAHSISLVKAMKSGLPLTIVAGAQATL